MTMLLLHKGAKEVTYEDIAAVPIPDVTDTWYPVPYRDAIDFVRERAYSLYGAVGKEEFALGRNDLHMFAAFKFEGDPGSDNGLCIGLRQSYDKTLALGIAAGARVFVCDNLAFSGDSFEVIRKNTRFVWQDFKSMVMTHLAGALESHKRLQRDFDKMKITCCSLDEGYALLGVAQGHDLLRPHQASVAFNEWTKPSHEEFADRNVWSLYNGVTESLKRGSPATALPRHANMHRFLMERC
jgi:hypothetical protein